MPHLNHGGFRQYFLGRIYYKVDMFNLVVYVTKINCQKSKETFMVHNMSTKILYMTNEKILPKKYCRCFGRISWCAGGIRIYVRMLVCIQIFGIEVWPNQTLQRVAVCAILQVIACSRNLIFQILKNLRCVHTRNKKRAEINKLYKSQKNRGKVLKSS